MVRSELGLNCSDHFGSQLLAETDQDLLASIRARQDVISTQIRSVADGYTHAFFLWGPGGHGKSHQVRVGLRGTTASSGTGATCPTRAFSTLWGAPQPCPRIRGHGKIYKSIVALSILWAACQGERGDERWIDWAKDGQAGQPPFLFRGGIIILSNEDPRSDSMKMGALASRFAPQEVWRLTNTSWLQRCGDIAVHGKCPWALTPEVRLEVAEFVIAKMYERPAGVQVDLRTLCEHAFPAYVQWRNGRTEEGQTHWQDVVQAKIEGGPRNRSRDGRLDRDRQIACEVYLNGKDTPSRHNLWQEQTGLKSPRSTTG